MKLVIKQISKFFIIGVSAVMVDFIVYYASTEFFKLNNDIGKSAGFLIGSIYTYYLNKRWTWRHTEKSNKGMLARFGIIYGLSFIGNVLINRWSLQLIPDYILSINLNAIGKEASNLFSFQADKLLAFFFATLFSAVFNFLGQKFWVFKNVKVDQLDETSIEVL